MARPRSDLAVFGLGMALAVLVLTLAVDLGFTKPQSEEVARLSALRDRLRQQLAMRQARDRQIEDLHDFLEEENLAGALLAAREGDPATYVAELLEQTNLVREELRHEESRETSRFRITQLGLDVRGSYEDLVAFIRTLEQGARLATIEMFMIETMAGERTRRGKAMLRAQITVSVLDPKE
jgi:Tfp pilus assembly protein PilO